jgi:hypothetical protein
MSRLFVSSPQVVAAAADAYEIVRFVAASTCGKTRRQTQHFAVNNFNRRLNPASAYPKPVINNKIKMT